MAANVQYPLQYLHMEIVRYLQSRHTEQSMVVAKLETMGFRIGWALAERLCREQAVLNTELDTLKFLCKEFWTGVFGKQVDTLKTNHQGVYVITDSAFSLLPLFSDQEQTKTLMPVYLALARGVVRGGLFNLGFNGVVTTDLAVESVVRFSVTLQPINWSKTK